MTQQPQRSVHPSSAPGADSLRRAAAPASRVPTALRVRRGLALAVAALALGYLAVRGAAYDAIVRREAGVVIWSLLAMGLAFGALPRGRLAPAR